MAVKVSRGPIRQWSKHNWKIELFNSEIKITVDEQSSSIQLNGSSNLSHKRKWFRWYLLKNEEVVVQLKGATKLESLLIASSEELVQATLWFKQLDSVISDYKLNQRWIPQEVIESIIQAKPAFSLLERKEMESIKSLLSSEELQAIDCFAVNIEELFRITNEGILESELRDRADFFRKIERKPLTEEQAKAVITFDNRVLLVASAGSGKTSVMIARAAYAVQRGFIDPSKILLLAFNKDAATELQKRIVDRFSKVGLDAEGITASTFHKFGLGVISKERKSQPNVAKWVDQRKEKYKIREIVDHLKASSEDFKYKWDLYRLILLPETTKLVNTSPDDFDRGDREGRYRTFDDNLVRSHGERMIANWLYLHGVNYEYERAYKHKTGSNARRQYTPDFYYKEIDAWHEHWALGLDQNPPKEFVNYKQDMNWKKSIHKKYQTDLIETTYGEVVYSDGLARLKTELENRGLKLTWNPNRPMKTYAEFQDKVLIGTISTFLSHVKSNGLQPEDLVERLQGDWKHLQGYRSELFLELFWKIFEKWNQDLRDTNSIDFDDMLGDAANLMERHNFVHEYDLILVDEFQDSSRMRGRVIKALLNKSGVYLLAVGDDWQSINRFAGAELSLMTSFHEFFGRGPTLQLTKTFRCNQVIASTATEFILKNPNQLRKVVESDNSESDNDVTLFRSPDETTGVEQALNLIDRKKIRKQSGITSVFVLGRYNHNLEWLPKKRFHDLDVRFQTIHASKGLEADYVVVVNVEAGTYGLPSEIEDDPIIELAMFKPEEFEHAEERRLLYVALTRARHGVILVTRKNKDSKFAIELALDERIRAFDVTKDGLLEIPIFKCKACKKGMMLQRSGNRGTFYECSRMPACSEKLQRLPNK